MSSGTLPEIIFLEHRSLYHLQMQVKDLSFKEEAICDYDPEMLVSLLGKISFEMERGRVDN